MHKCIACILLLFLLPMVSAQCQTGTAAACKNATFVPGHNLLGEGIDVTTLGRTGTHVVDTSRWRSPNGTCTLCRNPLQGGKWQRLPLAAVDWRVHSRCQWQLGGSVQPSALGAVAAAAAVVQNDWKVELDVTGGRKINGQVGLAGSHSKLAEFVTQKSQKDRYAFISHEVSCPYYRFGISGTPPLTDHFIQSVKNLPSVYNKTSQLEYHHLIHTYGTHYLTQASLGGRVRDVTAVRACQAALDGLSLNDIKDCLSVEAAVNIGVDSDQASVRECTEKRRRMRFPQGFHEKYRERYVEEDGGKNTDDLLFSRNYAGAFSNWVKTLKSHPGLLTYSLRPIHTLFGQDDPKREALRQAVGKYIRERALWGGCAKSCPQGMRHSARDPCSCDCHGDNMTNAMCCPRERGLALLSVTVEQASDLWGDTFSATDAYVKLFFAMRELRTHTLWNRRNPKWNRRMDFGSVHVTDTSQLRVEVWDKDHGWDDDLLGFCNIQLMAGGPHHRECYLKHGRVRLHYSLHCGPHLGGRSCSEYVPQPPQHTIAIGKNPF
ncbi:perforin-1-like [Pelodiscus sinensis]|uniref:perforin-1-like n=1 Tax=Pelodiscus sinensis TaxID=13735 RepID=UPI003F6B4FE6